MLVIGVDKSSIVKGSANQRSLEIIEELTRLKKITRLREELGILKTPTVFFVRKEQKQRDQLAINRCGILRE